MNSFRDFINDNPKKPEKKGISNECRCGRASADAIYQYAIASAYKYHQEGLERELNKLEEKVENMGQICKIEVGEPIKYIMMFKGVMDRIGYREKPEEGIGYLEIDLDSHLNAIRDSIFNSLDECEHKKSPLKSIKIGK